MLESMYEWDWTFSSMSEGVSECDFESHIFKKQIVVSNLSSIECGWILNNTMDGRWDMLVYISCTEIFTLS